MLMPAAPVLLDERDHRVAVIRTPKPGISALTVVTPKTFIGWHRKGFQLFWRRKCQSGRPRIPPDLQRLIRKMAGENPSWGQERITNELLLKLGLRVSPRTIRKYLAESPAAPT